MGARDRESVLAVVLNDLDVFHTIIPAREGERMQYHSNMCYICVCVYIKCEII